ncbi:MAG: hypothetical protein GQ574_22625 [Crocinitomix sp.]|nr:hypothetical protein [Crocinitomix sp.]
MTDSLHIQQIDALTNDNFSKLRVTRIDSSYYLLITIREETHVYLNKSRNRAEYRHAWQIKKWLFERFAIPENRID